MSLNPITSIASGVRDLVQAASGLAYIWAKDALFPPASLDLPFRAGVKGAVLEAQFRIRASESYKFELWLYFRETDATDRVRVCTLAGSGARAKDGRPIDTGLPIPIRLTVTRGELTVLEIVAKDHSCNGFSASAYCKGIAGVHFDPGAYRVRIEALEDIAALEDVPVRFLMQTSRRK